MPLENQLMRGMGGGGPGGFGYMDYASGYGRDYNNSLQNYMQNYWRNLQGQGSPYSIARAQNPPMEQGGSPYSLPQIQPPQWEPPTPESYRAQFQPFMQNLQNIPGWQNWQPQQQSNAMGGRESMAKFRYLPLVAMLAGLR